MNKRRAAWLYARSRLGKQKERMEVQTRNESGEIRVFHGVRAAFDHATQEDPTVWKVSWALPDGKRCRWVRDDIKVPEVE